MHSLLNPYIAGAPIVEPSMFFGRQDVFQWIERSLSGKYVNHILVIHGQRRVNLCHSEELKGSPFFNIFANVMLHPFRREEVMDMVEAYLRETGLDFPADGQESIYRLAGGYPFFVQIAGYYLVEAQAKGLSREEITRRMAAQFEQQADPHFTHLWSHCSESEKITLLVAISLNNQKPGKKTQPNLENLAKVHPRARLDVPGLLKRGLLYEDPTQPRCYKLLSESLVNWINREIAAGEESEESPASVENWLKSGGKEVVEPVKGALPRFKKKYWPIISTVLQEMSFELAGAATFEFLVKALI